MIPQQNQEEFYSRFLQKLESSQKWPGKFMFKFILKENSKKIIQLKKIFTNKSVIYSKKNSSKKRFQSLSIRVNMKSAEEVVEFYKKASKLDGVICL